MAELEVPDCGVAVPAFVGVFGPVHPPGVVGEVCRKVNEVEPEADDGSCKHEDVERALERSGQVGHAGGISHSNRDGCGFLSKRRMGVMSLAMKRP